MWPLSDTIFASVLCSNAFWLLVLALIGLKVYMLSTVTMCLSRKRIFGKTVVLTGATSGIGREIAKHLAYRGAKMVLGCRDLKEAEKLQEELYVTCNVPKNRIVVYHLDLTSLASVRKFASQVNTCEDRIDVLINNAGATGLGNKKTSDGLNIGMQVNHFAPFLLTTLLADKLKESAPSRIIWVTSRLNACAKFCVENLNFDKHFNEHQVYFCSKLANSLIANELAKKLKTSGVTVNTFHPGFTPTKIWQHFPSGYYILWSFILKQFFRSASDAAQTAIFLATDPHLENVTGKYFEDCQEKRPSEKSLNQVLGIQVYEKTVDLLGLKPHEVI